MLYRGACGSDKTILATMWVCDNNLCISNIAQVGEGMHFSILIVQMSQQINPVDVDFYITCSIFEARKD